MDHIYNNIEEYNPNKKRKILIVFYDMIVDMLSNKKLNPVITELYIRGRKLNIFLIFIMQSYFAVPKSIGRNSRHYLIRKLLVNKNFNKLFLIIRQILTLKTLIHNVLQKWAAKPYSFLVINATLASDNPLIFRKYILERIDDKIRDEKRNTILTEKQQSYQHYHLEKT